MVKNNAVLQQLMLSKSETRRWSRAQTEWSLDGLKEDPKERTECLICNRRIRWCCKIRNNYNGDNIGPLCLDCVETVANKLMTRDIQFYKDMISLREAYAHHEHVRLKAPWFSFRLISELHTRDFISTEEYEQMTRLYWLDPAKDPYTKQDIILGRQLLFHIRNIVTSEKWMPYYS